MNHVNTDDSVIFLAVGNSPTFSLCVNRQGRENLRILSICPGGYAFPAVWVGIARLPFCRRKSGLKIDCVLPGTGCNFKNSGGCRQTIAQDFQYRVAVSFIRWMRIYRFCVFHIASRTCLVWAPPIMPPGTSLSRSVALVEPGAASYNTGSCISRIAPLCLPR